MRTRSISRVAPICEDHSDEEDDFHLQAGADMWNRSEECVASAVPADEPLEDFDAWPHLLDVPGLFVLSCAPRALRAIGTSFLT